MEKREEMRLLLDQRCYIVHVKHLFNQGETYFVFFLVQERKWRPQKRQGQGMQAFQLHRKRSAWWMVLGCAVAKCCGEVKKCERCHLNQRAWSVTWCDDYQATNKLHWNPTQKTKVSKLQPTAAHRKPVFRWYVTLETTSCDEILSHIFHIVTYHRDGPAEPFICHCQREYHINIGWNE